MNLINRISQRNEGISLVEAIVIVFLVVLFSVVLMSIFIVQARITIIGVKTSEMHVERAQILRELKNNTRIASGVVASATVNTVTHNTGNETCIIRFPSIDEFGDIIPDTWDYGVYFLDSINPYRMYYSQEADVSSARKSVDKLLSDSVASLRFNYNGDSLENTEVLIANVQLQEAFFHKVEEVTLNLQLKLGNR